MGTIHEDPCTLMMKSHTFLLRMRNVSDKCCRENQVANFGFNNVSKNYAVYEMWKNMVQTDRPQMMYNTTHK